MIQCPQSDRPSIVAASLAVVSEALTAEGIWHSLAYGTLLGAVRDRDIIPWDHDFDLFARPNDILRILALNGPLAPHGLEIVLLRYPGSVLAMNPGGVAWFDPMHLQVRLDGEYIGDLFMPSLFADGVLRIFDFATDVYWTPHFSVPHSLFAETGAVVIRGRTYPAMGQAEAFLALMYGPNWRVPYRSVVDGGEPADGVTTHSHRYVPRLRGAIAQAEALGWDREAYRGLPAWPRRVAGAGPVGPSPRTRMTSRALWWHDLEELVAEY
jgi:hypothetical protein